MTATQVAVTKCAKVSTILDVGNDLAERVRLTLNCSEAVCLVGMGDSKVRCKAITSLLIGLS